MPCKMKFNVAILKNELDTDHQVWVDACNRNEKIGHVDVVDLLSDSWLRDIQGKEYDAFILKPSGIFAHLKQLYDERVLILTSTFNKALLYPSLTEALIYENKRILRDWLIANEVSHPNTFVFYNKAEAELFIRSREQFPLVAKTNIGASGNGVRILDSICDASKYVNEAFGKGIYTRTGPRLTKGSMLKKLKKVLKSKDFFGKRIKQYTDTLSRPQKDFVIFQEYILHEYEWRCVRIGESYFAHKKIARKNMASGRLIKSYDYVPLSLLDFIRDTTTKTNLTSVAIDLFEHNETYLVNEIQCIFGQSDPYQMLIDGKPGRYRWLNGEWIFEEGMFNTNQSYDLRVEHLIQILEGKNR